MLVEGTIFIGASTVASPLESLPGTLHGVPILQRFSLSICDWCLWVTLPRHDLAQAISHGLATQCLAKWSRFCQLLLLRLVHNFSLVAWRENVTLPVDLIIECISVVSDLDEVWVPHLLGEAGYVIAVLQASRVAYQTQLRVSRA